MIRYTFLLMLSMVIGLVSCNNEQKEKRVYDETSPINKDDIHWIIEYLVDSADLKIYFPPHDVRKNLYKDLNSFYKSNEYKLAWNSPNKPGSNSAELIQELKDSWKEGLEPENYRVSEMDSLQKAIFKNSVNPKDLHRIIHLDLLMTSSFLTYASHLVNGRINPPEANKTWITNQPREDYLLPILQKAVKDNQVRDALDLIRSSYVQYEKLQEKFVEYYEIERRGGWPQISEGPDLKMGARSPRVAALKRRLAITGDLPGYNAPSADSAYFTAGLEKAVIAFQDRHRLESTGIVNNKTLTALNIPAAHRVAQIKINLERLRWLPENLGGNYIMVNVPEYYLRIFEDGEIKMHMKVIVGEEFNSTPIFSDTVEYLVFSPYWNVPQSIATEEMLPKIKKNTNYLRRNHLELLSGWEKNPDIINPDGVNWASFSADYFPYRIRQKPGPWNSLGQVKFMFPNQMSIYLHDTPAEHLFAREERGLSHGCLRVRKPIELAEYLLRDQPDYDRSKIVELMNKGEETYVNLENEVPVHIIYWTAFVDDNGKLNFSEDIYSYDTMQIEAL